MIKKTLLIRILFFVVLVCFTSSTEVFAQQTQDLPEKRNSPFSPNPKRKTNTVPQTNQAAENTKNSITEKSSNAEQQKNVKPAAVQAENKIQPQTENVKFQSTEFENRSLANNTLEVARRAGEKAVSPTEIYKIGVGDVLFISLQNAPAKDSTYFTVLKDGTIDYPLAGEMISVTGLTTDEIEDALREKIKLYENPQVSVKVREHNSHSFTVLGLVEKAGEKVMQREAIPLFVVRAEAIVQSKANRAVIKRGNQQTETIDLRDSKSENILIFPGDIIEFDSTENEGAPAGQRQFFYIGGDVKNVGQMDFHKGITLTQAILVAGGLKKSGFLKFSGSKIVTIRRKNAEGLLISTDYDLKGIKDGKIADPLLEAGDTLEVDN